MFPKGRESRENRLDLNRNKNTYTFISAVKTRELSRATILYKIVAKIVVLKG